MKFLKGLAISLLSFLLFLSLAVFGTVFLLKSTLLNPDFVVTQVNKLDVASVVGEIAKEQLGGQSPAEAGLLKEALSGTIADYDWWLKEQLGVGIYALYDFLFGESESISLVVSLEPLKDGLRDNLWRVVQRNKKILPPEIATASPPVPTPATPSPTPVPVPVPTPATPDVLAQFVDQVYQAFAGQIPSQFAFDERLIPPKVMAQINQAKQYVGYVNIIYYTLMGSMVLLVLFIILLKRSVKGALRGLGITFLIYGIMGLASVYVIKSLLAARLPLPDTLPYLQAWLKGFLGDFVSPLRTLNGGLMACGVTLLATSFAYRFVYRSVRKATLSIPVSEFTRRGAVLLDGWGTFCRSSARRWGKWLSGRKKKI